MVNWWAQLLIHGVKTCAPEPAINKRTGLALSPFPIHPRTYLSSYPWNILPQWVRTTTTIQESPKTHLLMVNTIHHQVCLYNQSYSAVVLFPHGQRAELWRTSFEKIIIYLLKSSVSIKSNTWISRTTPRRLLPSSTSNTFYSVRRGTVTDLGG